MDIEKFKKLTLDEKLTELRYSGKLLGSYERNSENSAGKTPGDIFVVRFFFTFRRSFYKLPVFS